MEVAARKTILAPGDMLSCYRIENFLGQGGFGVTYLALDTKLDLQVAIKEYMPEQIAERTHDNSVQPRSPDEQTTFAWGLSRFIKEARTLAKFKHANIVRVMAVFEQNGTAYMVMEYERGQDLKGVLARSGKQTEQGLKKIISPVIDGLAEVHKHGYIHRDIKPANILIRHDGSPVLLDFGSARLATGAQTQALTALVSVGYAPLEQYNESNDVQQGPWTDVYALGAVLYFAITGNPPVDSTLRGSAVLNDRPDPLVALEKIAPEGFTLPFCRAIDWALSFKVKDRPQTLEQWRIRLMSDDETVLMPRVPTQSVHTHDEAVSPHRANDLAGGNATGTAEEATTGRRRRLRDPDGMDDLDSFATPNLQATAIVPPPADAELEWETRSERLQRQGFKDAVGDASTTSKPAVSRVLVACAITALLLLVPAIALKQHWLPALQGKATTDTASQPSVDNAVTDVTIPETTDQSAGSLATSAEAAAAEQLREEARLAAAASARQAAEELERQEQQAAKEALQQELDAAEKAAELARQQQADRVRADEREALLLAQRAAEATAERAREQAAQKLEAEKRESDREAQRMAEEAAIARQQEQEKQSELDTLASLEAEQPLPAPVIDPALQISDTDISRVLQRFNALRTAITTRNGEEMRRLTYESTRKYAYFDYLFSSFETIEVSLVNIQASRLDQTVRAELRVARMQRGNGDIAFPPTEFQTIPIHSVRTTGWSDVHW